MEEVFARAASDIALFIEAGAVLIVCLGGIEALYHTIASLFAARVTLDRKKSICVRSAMWLLLGLEFELAADIIRSAIAPTWSDIGQLGAIAVIRTFLNFFLERDIEGLSTAERPANAL
ncbi:MAG: DUF1622 domain-containing protein [Vulcanimicrobiaceae bacterium]